LNCTLKFNNQNKWRADGGRIKKRDSLCAARGALFLIAPPPSPVLMAPFEIAPYHPRINASGAAVSP
jgi:hypothetical protein